ncbi:MAG TPA: hypothetical protein DIT65_01555 [Cryomorphaceae bacterium]|nr:hypothetical protein [Cryomorphaceae bacterium]
MHYSFKHILAQLLSYTLHPGLLPTVGALYILFIHPDVFAFESIIKILFIVFTGTYLIPLLVIYILTVLGIIESVHLIRKQDRIYPYMVAAFSAILTSRILMNIGAPREIVYSTLASAFVLVVSSVLIPFFKSSAHMAGVAGFTGLYLALFERYSAGNLYTMFLLVGLCGATAWARILLKRHSLRELLSGAVLGFVGIYVLLSR